MIFWGLQFIWGCIAGYIAASFIESYLHQVVSDAPAQFVRNWKRHPRLYKPLRNAYYSHHVIHHLKTFRRDHVTQFETEAERQKLERLLRTKGRHGDIIIRGDYAMKLQSEGAVVFAFPAIFLALVAGLFLQQAVVLGMFVTLSLPVAFSYFVHPFLHAPFAEGQRRANWLVAALLRSCYGRAMYRNHFLHHRYGGTSNFNLVLGADKLRGRLRHADADDIAEMKAIGLPTD